MKKQTESSQLIKFAFANTEKIKDENLKLVIKSLIRICQIHDEEIKKLEGG